MNHFNMAFSAVFPMIFCMGLGFLLRKELDSAFSRKLTNLVFHLFLPFSLFSNIYSSDFRAAVNPGLIVWSLLYLTAIFFAAYFLIPRAISPRADAAVVVQGIFRSNYVIFGLVMAENIYGSGQLGVVSSLAAFLVPVLNGYAVFLFESYRGGRISPLRLLQRIFRNPLIIGGLLGLFFAATGLRLPAVLSDAVSDVGGIASPVALICLGSGLSFGSIRRDIRKIAFTSAWRLVLVPGIALILFAALGFRNVELVAVLAAFGSPAAVAGQPMAQAMGGNAGLAGEIIAVSSAASVLTIFLFVLALMGSGLVVV